MRRSSLLSSRSEKEKEWNRNRRKTRINRGKLLRNTFERSNTEKPGLIWRFSSKNVLFPPRSAATENNPGSASKTHGDTGRAQDWSLNRGRQTTPLQSPQSRSFVSRYQLCASRWKFMAIFLDSFVELGLVREWRYNDRPFRVFSNDLWALRSFFVFFLNLNRKTVKLSWLKFFRVTELPFHPCHLKWITIYVSDASIRNILLHRRFQYELQNHFRSAQADVALIVPSQDCELGIQLKNFTNCARSKSVQS